jgi:prevent-host-death family protein
MEHLNIAEFNRGQSSKLIRGLVADDKSAFINKNGKPIAVVISYDRYKRLLAEGIDVNEH